MSRILNIGSINLDEVFAVPHFVRPGETMACLNYERFIGGKGNNQSTALARAGANVFHAGRIGSDGRFGAEALRDSGVDINRILESDVPTGRAIIQVDSTGQNCIILSGGANRTITRSDMDSFLDGWGRGDAVLFQNEISEAAYAMKKAAQLGLRIFFNPSPADESINLFPLDKVDCFILNEVEGAILCGLEPAETEPKGILSCLRLRFPRADLVLTLGAAGSCYSGADGFELAVPAVSARVVDTTAAGDTFTGFFIASTLRGKNPAFALDEATRAAGICVSRKGAVTSIPRLSELYQQ